MVQDTPPLGGEVREGQRVAIYKESRIYFESAIEFDAYNLCHKCLLEFVRVEESQIRLVMEIPDRDYGHSH